MPFTILVPNRYAFPPKRTASFYLVYPGIRFLLCSETPSVSLSLWKLIHNWLSSSFACSYIAFYIAVKCVFVFVDIVIHPIIDTRFNYFIFVDRNRVVFIIGINKIKSPVVDFVIDSIVSADFNRLPGIICVIITCTVFIKIKF